MKVRQHLLIMATLIIFTFPAFASALTAAPGQQKACAKKKSCSTKKSASAKKTCAKKKAFDLEAFKKQVAKDPSILTRTSARGLTILHRAVLQKEPKLTAFLIEKGLDVNKGNKSKCTPLHYAGLRPNAAVIKILLENGADIDAKTDDGITPLAWAVSRGSTTGALLLMDNGADPGFIFEKEKRSLAHLSALAGDDGIMEKLLQKNAPVDLKDIDGFTPVDYAFKYGHVKVAKMLIKQGLKPSEGIKKNFGPTKILKKQLPEKTAVVWYLGNSGWAVKTSDKLLIFDYFRRTYDPVSPLLANGHINPEELKDLDVYIFVSHSHRDHYDRIIYDWRDKLKSTTYVMGFRPEKETDYIYMAPNSKKKIGNMKVLTVKAADEGVGFLVFTNGMSLFHAGDHFNKSKDCSGPFMEDMKKIATITKLDMAFLPIGGCGFGDNVLVRKGVKEALKTLQPKTFFPMHRRGGETQYRKMAKTLKKENINTPTACARNRGDHFVYKKGKVKQI